MKKQIKSRLLRILCTALSLCMIIALIPAAFAETVEEFSIKFATDAQFDDLVNCVSVEKAANSGVSANQVESKIYGWRIKSTQVEQYYAVKFVAPDTGKFAIEYCYYKIKNSGGTYGGGLGDVYLLDYDENTASTDINSAIDGIDNELFKNVEYYGDTGYGKMPNTPVRELQAGKTYMLVFVVTGSSPTVDGSTSFRMIPTYLTFTPYDPVNAVYSFASGDYSVFAPEGISYANSDGRIEYYGMDDESDTSYDSEWNAGCACIRLVVDGWVAYKFRVPAAGEYKLTLDYKQTTSPRNKTADAYIIPASYGVDLTKATLRFDNINFNGDGTTGTSKDDFVADSAGEYLLVFHADAMNTYVRPAKLTLSENSNIPGDVGSVGGINDGKANVYTEGDEITLEYTANNSVDGTDLTPEVSDVESSDKSVITIVDDTATAVGAGKATITANINGYPASWDVTVQSKALVDAFSDVDASGNVTVGEKANINILTYSTDETKQTYEDTIEAEYNKPTSITAPDLGEDYTFLYWAKGATDSKQIIPGETCTIYPTVETTYLIAVYEPISGTTGNKVEFYNYNGQLLTDARIDGGKMPELPYMTGYGKASHWAHYGSDVIYGENDPAPEISGTEIFVAQYDDLQENITVTAENCTVNGKSSATVKYGDIVRCFTTGDGDKTFKWWTKTVNGKTEIVSLNENYTFNAWETCTVTAVYGDKAPTYVGDTMRIILDELTVEGKTAYMAEFVGLERAVEKGIMLGTTRYAMSSKDNQFTIINDEGVEAANIKGYAILANGTLITDK